MEPVARRTRRGCEENLMKRWRSWKKAKTSSSGETVQVPVDVSSAPPTSDTMSNARRSISISANRDSRQLDDDEDFLILQGKPVISSSPPIVVISSSSEAENETEDEVSGSSEDSDSDSNSVRGDFVGAKEENGESSSSEGEDDEEEMENGESSSSEGEDDEEEMENGESSSIEGEDDEQEKGKREVCAREAKIYSASGSRSKWCSVPQKSKFTNSIECPNIVLDHTDNHNEVYNDGDADIVEDENEVEGEEKIVKEAVQPNKQETRKPLTADEIHHVLYNSIMEDGNSNEIEEPVKLHVTEDEDTSSSDVDSADRDKSETEIDYLYKMLDFCLVCGDDNDSANLDDGKKQEELCNKGKHYLFVDEEIGLICKKCGIVKEEMKHITPHFHNNPFGVLERSEHCTYYNRDAGGLPHFEDPNTIGQQHYQEDVNFNSTGTVWEIIPGLRRTLLPHQREAFEFLWRNIAGGTKLDEVKSSIDKSKGGVCLISHAPGTGKTRLSIAFLEAYMKLYEKCRPLIIAPASILLTWKQEFNKWKVGIPFVNMNDEDLSLEELAMANSLFRINYDIKLTLMDKRMIKLLFWCKKQSVLAVSYTLLSQLADGDRMKKNGPLDQSEMIRKILIEFPGLLILDEGHMPRNDKSSIFKVLSDVETKKRFILSGTPFQNNFRELHNILCLVRPEFNKGKNPFKSDDEDEIRELKANIKRFSHCYDGYVVSAMVPGLVDNIIYLEPSEHQSKLLKDLNHKANHFEVNVDMTLISVHPLLFQCKSSNTNFSQELKSKKWDLADGAKTMFLKRLIQLSSALKERVLVFSQYLDPLNFVKAVLESSEFGWIEGREILLMSGKQDMKTRKRSLDFFNNRGSEGKVMLASTKACSEGIELTVLLG